MLSLAAGNASPHITGSSCRLTTLASSPFTVMVILQYPVPLVFFASAIQFTNRFDNLHVAKKVIIDLN